MTQTVRATCINGELVLQEKLSSQLEGETVEVAIRKVSELAESLQPRVSEAQIRQFFEKAQQFSAKLPADYKFDRDELYER